MLTIYNFPGGARGVRVAWLCEEMGVPYRMEPLQYPAPDSYRAKNPLGQVPFLEDGGGVAITESIAMLFHIAETRGPTQLLPPIGDARRARILQMMLFAEATLGVWLGPLFVDKFAMPDAEKNGPLAKTVYGRAEQAIGFVEHILGGNAYLAGADFTMADIAVAPGLAMWCGPLGGKLPSKLTTYQQRVTARPAYQKANAAR